MDLETENRIAAILLKEAAELRRQAHQEGALAYLREPTVRGRPNSRFLTATVRGIQQANRAVEINEMWRVRKKERELDDRVKGRPKDGDSHVSREGERELSQRRSKRHDSDASCSSSKRLYDSRDDEGLRDEEIEKFLHSRVKRGRGSIGSRMDETGPYLPTSPEATDECMKEEGRYHRDRAVVGPEKPSSWKRKESSDESSDEDTQKRSKAASGGSKKKKHSKNPSSKGKSRDKRKKKKEKRQTLDRQK